MSPKPIKLRPIRHDASDKSLQHIYTLIRNSFAYMDDRIDPPSSMHRMTLSNVAHHCVKGEVWSIGSPPVAVVFLTPKPDCLYIGKLAVATRQRGKGLAHCLIDLSERRAIQMGLHWLELEVRVELVENQAVFARFGFVKTAETAHAGYSRPTSFTFRKAVSGS